MPKTKRKPLGRALPKFDGEIAAPTEVEVNAFDAIWDANAPAQYRGILRAKSKSLLADGEIPESGWIWDDADGVYIHAQTGRRVTRKEAHQALSSFVERYGGL